MFAKLMGWIDDRFPLTAMYNDHGSIRAPKNLNFWYFFGSLAMLVLVNQIITGIWLTMNYNPSAEGAFASVEYIMRDVDYGWIIRVICTPPGHPPSSSWFTCTCSAAHLRLYQKPRELLWIFGMLIFPGADGRGLHGLPAALGPDVVLGAQVIISLFGAIPLSVTT